MFKIWFFPLSVPLEALSFVCHAHCTTKYIVCACLSCSSSFTHGALLFLYGMESMCTSCLCSFDCRMNFSRWLTLRCCCTTTYIRAVGENVCIWNAQSTWTFGSLQHTYTCRWHSVCRAVQCTNDTFYDELALVLLTVASTGFLCYFMFSFRSQTILSRLMRFFSRRICFFIFVSLFHFLHSDCVAFCWCSFSFSLCRSFSCFKLIFNYRSIFCCIWFVFFSCFVFLHSFYCHAHVFFPVGWSVVMRLNLCQQRTCMRAHVFFIGCRCISIIQTTWIFIKMA